MIAYGLLLGFVIKTDNLIYNLIFFGSLILISLIFVIKGKTIASTSATESSKNTKRNLFILLAFVVIIVIIFYIFSKTVLK
jgi:amino acid permease